MSAAAAGAAAAGALLVMLWGVLRLADRRGRTARIIREQEQVIARMRADRLRLQRELEEQRDSGDVTTVQFSQAADRVVALEQENANLRERVRHLQAQVTGLAKRLTDLQDANDQIPGAGHVAAGTLAPRTEGGQ